MSNLLVLEFVASFEPMRLRLALLPTSCVSHPGLFNDTTNKAVDTVPLIIWSAAEMSITLMCVGIPILLPLWRRVVRGSKISSERYYRRHGESYGEGFNLGSVLLGSDKANNRGFPNAPAKLGIRGPGTITRIAGDNYSDESILGSEYRRGGPSPVGGICVKQDIQIDWSDAKDIRQ